MNGKRFKEMPKQPDEKEWGFINDLKAPLHGQAWGENREALATEADLRKGVTIEFNFADPDELLDTAYTDFWLFLKSGGVKEDGAYRLIIEKNKTSCFEEYHVEITRESCRISAGDTEGIRRALVWIEDEMQRTGGAFLPIGSTTRKPWIKTRISRCFFGPIKRPPMNRDELVDDIDYYPPEYLNKLAHEGVNALWLTIAFGDLCYSKYFPEDGKDRKRRLEKLRRTVEKCARYGIRIYLFCTEPIGFGEVMSLRSSKEAEINPVFAGHRQHKNIYFCTSSAEALDYIESCTEQIFSEVPGLGGLIDINLGELPTHCYSDLGSITNNSCPRCSKRKPHEVLSELVSSFAKGMNKGNPDAVMISWLYVPVLWDCVGVSIDTQEQAIRKFAANIPENVVLLYNFESNGLVKQLGHSRIVEDYSLAWPGPSEIFKDCAEAALSAGACVAAKIQAGCSHEVATVPFVPVPGNLFRKYQAMHEIGVNTVLQCWYFGNYPGLMNKSAGELSFAPFSEDEDGFLLKLAKSDWGKHAETVVKAWKHLQDGYLNFPANLGFAWYGPVHNSLVWPLYLFPVDKPISLSWHFEFPIVSGDRIGECIGFEHTLDEIVILLERVASSWGSGVELFKQIEHEFRENSNRQLDIFLAEALGLQFRSASNVFNFYALREQLPYDSEQIASLAKMRKIVLDEISNSLRMSELCRQDPRLGFHSEAENYKYFPKWLEQRVQELKDVLKNDFSQLEAVILAKHDVFPEYTGVMASGNPYLCTGDKESAECEKLDGSEKSEWCAYISNDFLHFTIKCSEKVDSAQIILETRRLWPVIKFQIFRSGKMEGINQRREMETRWNAEIIKTESGWQAEIDIPMNILNDYAYQGGSMRFNIVLFEVEQPVAWRHKLHPFSYRLKFGTDNPEDLDWILVI